MRRPESALKVMELARQSPIVRLAFGLKISQCKA